MTSLFFDFKVDTKINEGKFNLSYLSGIVNKVRKSNIVRFFCLCQTEVTDRGALQFFAVSSDSKSLADGSS